jgi:hypothetical protein
LPWFFCLNNYTKFCLNKNFCCWYHSVTGYLQSWKMCALHRVAGLLSVYNISRFYKMGVKYSLPMLCLGCHYDLHWRVLIMVLISGSTYVIYINTGEYGHEDDKLQVICISQPKASQPYWPVLLAVNMCTAKGQ